MDREQWAGYRNSPLEGEIQPFSTLPERCPTVGRLAIFDPTEGDMDMKLARYRGSSCRSDGTTRLQRVDQALPGAGRRGGRAAGGGGGGAGGAAAEPGE